MIQYFLAAFFGLLVAGCFTSRANALLFTSESFSTAARLPFVQFAQATPSAVSMQNSAKISVKMTPDSPVPVGAKINFEITSARRGYVLLVDIDAKGKMTQIFPNPELLERTGNDEINAIPAKGKLEVPNDAITKLGIGYNSTGPVGSAAIVALFSPRKIQLIDLPDSQRNETTISSVTSLFQWIKELRVPDPKSGKLLPAEWSADFKTYEIR